MSADAARIIDAIQKKSTDSAEKSFCLGEILSTNPLQLKLDNVGFTITNGILINRELLECEKKATIKLNTGEEEVQLKFQTQIQTGDRVAVGIINLSTYIILCKV